MSQKEVYIEGIDCSGKTTIIDALRKEHTSLTHKHLLHHRGPISGIVYAKLNSRVYDTEVYWEMLSKHTVIVFLILSFEEVKRRMIATNHYLPSDLVLDQELRYWYDVIAEADSRGFTVIKINGNSDLGLNMDKIVREISEL